jgi:hypothetical protein
LQKEQRDGALVAELDEVGPLLGAVAVQHAVVGEDPHLHALNAGKAVTKVVPNSALNSSKSEPSTSRAINSRAS